MNTCIDCKWAVPIYPTASGKRGLFSPETMTHCSIPRVDHPVTSWAKLKSSPCHFNPSRWHDGMPDAA